MSGARISWFITELSPSAKALSDVTEDFGKLMVALTSTLPQKHGGHNAPATDAFVKDLERFLEER